MKKLLLLLPLIICFAAFSQHPGYVKRNTKDQVIASAADSTAHMPAGATNTLSGGWAGAGAYRFNTTDSGIYVWTGTQWIRGSQEIYDHIVSGLGVSWNSGRIYDIAAGVAYVGGVRVTYAGGQATLAIADVSNPRIDNIVLNNDGSGVTVITGTPSANPSKPTPDASTQFELTFAQLDAGASQPNNVGATTLWDGEGADLLTGTTTGTVTFNNTVHAQHGTHSTFVASGGLSGAQQITYKNTTVYNIADYNNIKLYIWLNVALAGARSPDISLLNGNGVITNVRPLTDLGLNRNLTGQWQTIIVPLAGFNYTNSNFTGIRIGRFNNTIGNFWIDNIQLGTLSVVTIGGNYLPLSFPSDQTVNGNGHSLTFSNLAGLNYYTIHDPSSGIHSQMLLSPGDMSWESFSLTEDTSTQMQLNPTQYVVNAIKNGSQYTLNVGIDSIVFQHTTGSVYDSLIIKAPGLIYGGTFNKILAYNTTTGEIGFTDGGGGGSGLFPLTGTGTATGDVIGAMSSHNLSITGTTGNFSAIFDDATTTRSIGTTSSQTNLSAYLDDASSGAAFSMDATGGIIVNLLGTSTFNYGGDYSANYTSRSLVDKGYVDGLVGIAHQTLTYSGTTNGDLSLGTMMDLTLTGNTTLSFSNIAGPFVSILNIIQGGSGGYNITWPTGTKIPNGFALSSTVGQEDQVTVTYDGVYYRLSIDNDYALAPVPPSFITWNSIHSDLEQYNSSEGIRKKAGSSDGWNTTAWSNETVSSGESVTVILDGTTQGRIIGLNSTRAGSGSANQWTFALYVTSSSDFQIYDNSGVVNPSVSYSNGDWARVRDTGSAIVYEKSTTAGASWTTIGTAVTTPSGNYFVGFEAYHHSGGFSEVFK